MPIAEEISFELAAIANSNNSILFFISNNDFSNHIPFLAPSPSEPAPGMEFSNQNPAAPLPLANSPSPAA